VTPRFSYKIRSLLGSRAAVWTSELLQLPTWQKAVLGCGILLILLGTGFFVYAYSHFSDLIDQRLSGQIFDNASLVFAAPAEIAVGDSGTPEEIAGRLRRAFYSESSYNTGFGTYRISDNRLEVHPGPASFFEGDRAVKEGPAVIQFKRGKIASIKNPERENSMDSYLL
jgi:hypothetical protein